jgi:hypothetical protein
MWRLTYALRSDEAAAYPRWTTYLIVGLLAFLRADRFAAACGGRVVLGHGGLEPIATPSAVFIGAVGYRKVTEWLHWVRSPSWSLPQVEIKQAGSGGISRTTDKHQPKLFVALLPNQHNTLAPEQVCEFAT